ncbi:MAG: PAS domain-containing protein [Candidatus Gracilibacteria bacterium]|jgi:PAS domain S-box-containing protein
MKKSSSLQNKKIAIAAISVFVVSLTTMTFFLSRDNGFENGQANLLHSGSGESGHGKTDLSNAENSAEAALENQYRKELGNIQEPIFALYASGKFKYASESFCELIKKDCDSLNGKLFYNFINSKDLPNLISALTEILAGKTEKHVIGPFRMLQGKQEIVVIFTALPVDGDQNDENIIFSVKDITEQVEDLDHIDNSTGVTVPENSTETEPAGSPAQDDWLKVLYPKFKELEDSKVAARPA